MIRKRLAVLLLLAPFSAAFAELWEFESAVDVTAASNGGKANFFHHLDSAGRRNIATNSDGVAITWEDDRDGTPRIYLAYKGLDESAFSREVRLSGEGEAYEPTIIALDRSRYAVAWEENGHVMTRSVSIDGKVELGQVVQLSETAGAQANLTQGNRVAYALWSERASRYGRIRYRPMTVDESGTFQLGEGCYIDPIPPADEQLYPTAAVSGDELIVVWEDRRPKHTIIMAATGQSGKPCQFSEPLRISEKPDGRDLPYGTGHGVSRVALGTFGKEKVFAAWADKRNFRDGYDIWGAEYTPDETGFRTNEKVQDDFSGLSKQRNATVDGHANGLLVVAWSDEREGHTDVMLSWREQGEWSDDWTVSVASGAGHQNNPTIALDDDGNLHVAWVERKAIGGTTRLKYAFGKLQGD
ncbi:MAG: hypothetical protein KZQ93_04770 [Candidatus Thiodiazotropha sp. (ex Monitilora ramsayi)]|nr:hypothetical protein [Candidatus Thiodiazotropha sp. (ex Monitilora ramsayi)]